MNVFIAALMRCNLYIIKFTHIKCYCSANFSAFYTMCHSLILEHFDAPPKKTCSYHSLSDPQPYQIQTTTSYVSVFPFWGY